MGFPLFVARRYLLASRKQAVVFVISMISIIGVIVGVAALVVVLALMTGFQEQIQSKILGANAHLTSIASQVTGDLTALSRPAPSGRDGAFLGRDLAASLGVQPGELVRLIIARPNVSPLLTVPRSREFEVLGTFETGFYEYD